MAAALAWLALGAAGPALDADLPVRVPPGYEPQGEAERGLWMIMDRLEQQVAQSHFVLHDPALQAYLKDILCRLAPDYCAEIRIYVLRAPFFNAAMGANGQMHIYTGLLLRVRDEAQLAAVMGHELGHYTRAHSLHQRRMHKITLGAANFLAVGGLGDVARFLAEMNYPYSRHHERESDEIGTRLMAAAGYDPVAASEVWAQIAAEGGRKLARSERRNAFYRTHPTTRERRRTLARRALDLRVEGGKRAVARFDAALDPWRVAFLEDQLTLNNFDATHWLIEDLRGQISWPADLTYLEAEMYRRRGWQKDRARALKLFRQARALGAQAPEIDRGIGLVLLKQGRIAAARAYLARYLTARPEASDAAMLRHYLKAEP
ncbi:MAG: M48 family metallopeptidase [Rhodothalassiaceae bacterium]